MLVSVTLPPPPPPFFIRGRDKGKQGQSQKAQELLILIYHPHERSKIFEEQSYPPTPLQEGSYPANISPIYVACLLQHQAVKIIVKKGINEGERKKNLLELASLQLAGGDGFLNACET